MLDRAAFPRDKACGDGIAFEATEALDGLVVKLPAGTRNMLSG